MTSSCGTTPSPSIPNSAKVVLLSPSGSPHPYFAFTGWLTNEPGVAVPTDNTVWEQEGTGPLTAHIPRCPSLG